MALNPPLLPNRHPAPVNGEYLVLDRKDIEAEIVLDNKQKYKGKGKLYLTTLRLVFVNKNNEAMISFDVPIDLMSNEKFNQPIFGANYISGRVLPLYDLLPCPANFKFWFMSGGTGTFLPLFYNLSEQIRRQRQRNNYGPDPRFVECVANGNLRNVAYVDPNDPSVIFVQQPSPNTAPAYNVNYYFPQPGAMHPQSVSAPNHVQVAPSAPPGYPVASNQNYSNQPAPVYGGNAGVYQAPPNPSAYQAVPAYGPGGQSIQQFPPGYPVGQNYQANPGYSQNPVYSAGPAYPPANQANPYYQPGPAAYPPPPGQPHPSPDYMPPGYSPPANYSNLSSSTSTNSNIRN